MQSAARESILLIDDDSGHVGELGPVLLDLAALRVAASAEALASARESPPDLILIDAQIAAADGFEIFGALMADPALSMVPVMLVTDGCEPAFEEAGFAIGAADFIVRPVRPRVVAARVRTQLRFKQMADALRRSATIDGVTGISNRQAFDEALAREWRQARRIASAVSLLMVEIDHVETFDGRPDPAAADACLREVAQALARAAHRPADVVARHDDAVFAMLLPATARAGAAHVARVAFDALTGLGHAHGPTGTIRRVTARIGGSGHNEGNLAWGSASFRSRPESSGTSSDDASRLVRAAQRALAVARSDGRGEALFVDLDDADAKELEPGAG